MQKLLDLTMYYGYDLGLADLSERIYIGELAKEIVEINETANLLDKVD